MSVSSKTLSLLEFSRLCTDINADLLAFAQASFEQHPFNVQTTSTSTSTQPSEDCAVCPSYFSTYQKVYALVAGIGLVEGQHHRQVLLLCVVATSIKGWMKMLCDATGARLEMPDLVNFKAFSFDRFLLSLTESSARHATASRIYPERRIDPAGGANQEHNKDIKELSSNYDLVGPFLSVDLNCCDRSSEIAWKTAASQKLWQKLVRQIREAWEECAPKRYFLNRLSTPMKTSSFENQTGIPLSTESNHESNGMHLLLTFSYHFHRLQDVLSVVFLRLQPEEPCIQCMSRSHSRQRDDYVIPGNKTRFRRSNIINDLCRCIARSILEKNVEWISSTLSEITSFTLGGKKLDLLGSLPFSACSSPLPNISTPSRLIVPEIEQPLTNSMSSSERETRFSYKKKIVNTLGVRPEDDVIPFPPDVKGYPSSEFSSWRRFNFRRVFCIFTMIEDCGVDVLLESVTRMVNECCIIHGQKVASTSIAKLLDSSRSPFVPLREKPAKPKASALASIERESLVEVNKVLREALRGFICLRSALMMFSTGMTQYMDALTPWGRDLLIKGLRSFIDGLTTSGSAALEFVDRWGVAIWIQLCEETNMRHKQDMVLKKASRTVMVHYPDVWSRKFIVEGLGKSDDGKDSGDMQKVKPWTSSLLRSSRVIGTAIPVLQQNEQEEEEKLSASFQSRSSLDTSSMNSFAEVASCSTSEALEQERGIFLEYLMGSEANEQPGGVWAIHTSPFVIGGAAQLHAAAQLPEDGLPTFLFLFTRHGPGKKRVMRSLEYHITRYLEELLCASTASSFGRNKVPTHLLPQNVFEMCVFMLRMTQIAFNVDSSFDQTGDKDIEGIIWQRSRVAPRPFTGHSANLQERVSFVDRHDVDDDAPHTLREIALRVLHRGLHFFFAKFETSVSFTLAYALHAQVAENEKRVLSCKANKSSIEVNAKKKKLIKASSLKVINLLLELVSLLPSKDLFISCYQNFMAPSVLCLKNRLRLEIEKEVFSHVTLWLGVSLTGSCLALLRDLERAIDAAHGLVAGVKPEKDGRHSAFDARQPSRIENKSSSQTDTHQVLSFAAAAAARAATLLPFNTFSNPLTTFVHSSVGISSKTTLQNIITHGHPLLRRVYFLCETWWKPHVFITLSHNEIQLLFEEAGFFSEEFVDAVLKVVWYYSNSSYALGENIDKTEPQQYPGYSPRQDEFQRLWDREASNVEQNALQDISLGSLKVAHKKLSHAPSNLSQTRAGIESGSTTSGMDKHGYGEPHRELFFQNGSASEASFSDKPPTHRFTSRWYPRIAMSAAVSFVNFSSGLLNSSVQTGTPNGFANQYCNAVFPNGSNEHRRLSWPLFCGQLTFIMKSLSTTLSYRAIRKQTDERTHYKACQKCADRCHCITSSSPAVQVTGPPIVLVLLQLLHQARRDRDKKVLVPLTTLEWVHAHIPIRIGKAILKQLLVTLVRFGLVQRELNDMTKEYLYCLPDELLNITDSKVIIDLTKSLQNGIFTEMGISCKREDVSERSSSESSAMRKEVDDINDEVRLQETRSKASCNDSSPAILSSRQVSAHYSNRAEDDNQLIFMTNVRRVEICIVQALKASHKMYYSELFEYVVEQLKRYCSVSVSLFKMSVSNLVEKEFIKNENNYEYTYIV